MSVFRAMSCRAVSIQPLPWEPQQCRVGEKKNNPAGRMKSTKKVEKKWERERKLVVIRKADVRLTHCNLGNKMERGCFFSPPQGKKSEGVRGGRSISLAKIPR